MGNNNHIYSILKLYDFYKVHYWGGQKKYSWYYNADDDNAIECMVFANNERCNMFISKDLNENNYICLYQILDLLVEDRGPLKKYTINDKIQSIHVNNTKSVIRYKCEYLVYFGWNISTSIPTEIAQKNIEYVLANEYILKYCGKYALREFEYIVQIINIKVTFLSCDLFINDVKIRSFADACECKTYIEKLFIM